jgi:hypothetical protein
MTSPYGIALDDASLRWAAAEGVSETVIAAVLLLHERSVDEIARSLSAADLEQVIVLVGRSPRVYPPGTLEALKSKRNASPTPMAESPAKKQTPSTAGADHPLRDHTRAYRGFDTAAQQSTIEHVGGAAASQNTAALTDQPAARIKPDAEQKRMAHERRLAMLRAHTPQSPWRQTFWPFPSPSPAAAAKPHSCRLYRPQNGLQQVVVVARASLDRERFDLGDRNPGLTQSPLHALDYGKSIFILAEQGDADIRIFAAHVSLPLASRRCRRPSLIRCKGDKRRSSP